MSARFAAGSRSEIAEAAALLMRELVCEQISRERKRWNDTHPCRALGIRTIEPHEIVNYVDSLHLLLTSGPLRAEASRILDLIVAARTP